MRHTDPFDIDHMYYQDGAGNYRSIRTTSQVENLNRRYNNIIKAGIKPELADAIIADFTGRNNISQAVRAKHSLGLPPGAFDLSLVSRLNALCPRGRELFPEWARLEKDAEVSRVEHFGFRWQERQATEAMLEAVQALEGLREPPVVVGEVEHESDDEGEEEGAWVCYCVGTRAHGLLQGGGGRCVGTLLCWYKGAWAVASCLSTLTGYGAHSGIWSHSTICRLIEASF